MISDAAYRKHVGGPSHGHKHAKKLVKIARVVPEISSRTDRQTHRQTYSSQYFATASAGEVKMTACCFDYRVLGWTAGVKATVFLLSGVSWFVHRLVHIARTELN